jgi:hypothetical protein
MYAEYGYVVHHITLMVQMETISESAECTQGLDSILNLLNAYGL